MRRERHGRAPLGLFAAALLGACGVGDPFAASDAGARPDGGELDAGPSPTCDPADLACGRRTRLRLLVVTARGDEPPFRAVRSALDRIGVPYDVAVTHDGDLPIAELGGDRSCGYQGVVFAIDGLVPDDDGEVAADALSVAERDALVAFEAACDAREVVWSATARSGLGLGEAARFDGDDAVDAHVTAAGEAIFSYLRSGATLPIRDVSGQRARILDPTRTTALVAADGGVLVAVHRRDDGREVLALTIGSRADSRHAHLLEYGVVRWLTRGVFVGERRMTLSPQIDDVFFASEMYVPGVGDDSGVTYRIAGADLRDIVAWQDALRDRLPAGSRFVTTLAFNGEGTLPGQFADATLMAAFAEHRHAFAWLGHTWDHADLDPASASEAEQEIRRNCARADELDMPGFTCDATVTPMHSGLENPDAVAGLIAAGIRFVVTDTSHGPSINPDNPGTNPSPNVGRPNPIDARLYQVPRHPTDIYFNTATAEALRSRYNEVYADHFGRALDYDEIIAYQAELGIEYLLTYDIDPLMFHQANLHTWRDDAGRIHSLYGDWIDAVTAEATALVDLPIRSLSLVEIGEAMQRRGRFDVCGAVATLVRAPDGARVEVAAAGACVVPLTGVADPRVGTVDEYGGEPTTYVAVDGDDGVVAGL